MTPVGPGRKLLLVAAVALAAGLPALAPGFIHDDHPIVERNELTRDLSRVPEIFTRGYWSVAEVPVTNLYRPLTVMSFALNRALLGSDPIGYRLVNLALHILATLLVLWLARRVLPLPDGTALTDPALLAALLFAVHPVHTEVLGEIVGRSELLAAAGTLGCVLAFLRGRQRETSAAPVSSWPWFVLSLACFALALLSKENAVVAPLLVFAADRLATRRRLRWGYYAAAMIVLVAWLSLRMSVIGGINPAGSVHYVDNPIAHMPFLPGRLMALKVLARYGLLLIAPVRLAIDYSYDAISPASGLLDPAVLLGAALLAGWVVLVVALWKRAPRNAFGLFWTGVALAPTSNLIVPIGTVMAERLLYLPSVGFCLLAGTVLARLSSGQPGHRRVAWGLFIVLLLSGLAGRSVWRLRDWRDDYTVFKASVKVAPRSVRGLFNYGAASETRGDDSEAARVYREAIAIWPAFADAQYNLAGVYGRDGNWADAVTHYRLALKETPRSVPYLVNLGRSLNALERTGEAREVLQQAVVLDPLSDRAYNNLGAAHLALGGAGEAVIAYREAVRLDPGNAEYLMNLGLAQEASGDVAAARVSCRRALELRPADPEILAGFGVLLMRTGDAPAAIEVLERAVEAGPTRPILRYQLGRALEQDGRQREALGAYREAIRLAPGSPVPLHSLGLLLYRMDDHEGAKQALQRCAALDSGGSVMDEEARGILEKLMAEEWQSP